MTSLRGRLLLGVIAIMLVALVAADIITYAELSSFLAGRTDQSLQQAVGSLGGVGRGQAGVGAQGHPAAPGGPGGLGLDGGSGVAGAGGSGFPASQGSNGGGGGLGQSLPPPVTIGQRAPGYFVELRRANGTVAAGPIAAHIQGGMAWSPTLPRVISGFSDLLPGEPPEVFFSVSADVAGGPTFRILAVRHPSGTVLIVGAVEQDDTLTRLLNVELGVTGGALIAALILGWWLVRLGLRPLLVMEETATDIATGNLRARVPGGTDKTEVGRLAQTLNGMLARIEEAFGERDATEAELRDSEDRLRRFVADASHELRTPLAAVSAYAELFDRGAREHPEDLERLLSGIRSEAARMSRLVDDLLLLARLDQGRPLEEVEVDLVAIAEEAASTSRAVGASWPVTVESTGPVAVTGDPARLHQVADNLLANVRAHTPVGTAATVRVEQDGESAIFVVADGGPGVVETERLFERFHREDPARSPGGSGLGLSIVAAVVAAHGGTVEAAVDGGLIVTVRLPVLRAAPFDEGSH